MKRVLEYLLIFFGLLIGALTVYSMSSETAAMRDDFVSQIKVNGPDNTPVLFK